MHTHIDTYRHTHIHTYIHTYTHACIHTYIPSQHGSSINIKLVYTATTQTDFMRIVATKDFSPFYCKQANFNVLMVL